MNIFVLDKTPEVAASYHCDKHVVKMIVETAQLLSTTVKYYGCTEEGLYRPTHQNHPCSIWVRSTQGNYWWTWRLGMALLNEYSQRYSKVHATSRVLPKLGTFIDLIPSGPLQPFVQCFPEEFQHQDPIQGYRQYYKASKGHFAVWKNSPIPEWFND